MITKSTSWSRAAAPSLLFVYKLDEKTEKEWFKLRELDIGCSYEISCVNHPEIKPMVMSAEQLVYEGVPVKLIKKFSAAYYVINISDK